MLQKILKKLQGSQKENHNSTTHQNSLETTGNTSDLYNKKEFKKLLKTDKITYEYYMDKGYQTIPGMTHMEPWDAYIYARDVLGMYK